jgi:hypothetical protein
VSIGGLVVWEKNYDGKNQDGATDTKNRRYRPTGESKDREKHNPFIKATDNGFLRLLSASTAKPSIGLASIRAMHRRAVTDGPQTSPPLRSFFLLHTARPSDIFISSAVGSRQ